MITADFRLITALRERKFIPLDNTIPTRIITYTNTTIALSPSSIGSSVLNHYVGFSADFITKYVSRQYLDNTQKISRSIDPYLVNNVRISYDFGGIEFCKISKLLYR